ncbi:MAG TPA: hypothetical protein VLJ62_33185, partial [Burkholderiaceae bacterium]|nr:hypothetical protein [Burkholderiaceae bacterium]
MAGAAPIVIAMVTGLHACGGSDQGGNTEPELRVSVDPSVIVARQNESVTLRVDVPDVPDADLPSDYAFDLDEVVGQIDVTTAPCPAGAGSRACQDWTITPRAGSVPGSYEVNVKTVGSRAGTGDGAFALTVVLAPAPTHGAAVSVSHHATFTLFDGEPGRLRNAGHTLVLNERGEVFALGYNSWAQARLGYLRRHIDAQATTTAIEEPYVVSEFVAAPLPSARWSAIHASPSRSFALRDDGSLWAWGGFDSVAAALPVAGLSDVRAISPVSSSDAFVLLGDGRVLRSDLAGQTRPYCELARRGGALGSCARGEIEQLRDVRALFARSDRDVLFLKNDGTVWRGIGLLGAAWQAGGLPAIEAVAISGVEVPILLAGDGTVWTLDDDDNGVPVAGIDGVAAIAVRR